MYFIIREALIMIRRQIIATSEVDRQKQRLSLDVLAEFVIAFSSNATVTCMNINHDCTALPIGKVLSGSLKQLDNGETALEVLIDDFADSFVPCVGPNGESLYFGESLCDARPFVDFQAEINAELIIMLNPLNFAQDDYNDVVSYLRNCCDAQVETTIEKSCFPDPKIVFNFAAGYLLGILGKQTLSKTNDKLSEEISDDFLKCYIAIKNAIKKIAQKIQSRGQIVYIFTEPGQPVELVIKAKKANTVLIAFDALKGYDIKQKVQQFDNYTNKNLKKIQFVYDEIGAKWELSYLTTNTGQVIGTEVNYKRTIQMYRSVLDSPTAGFSIGGSALISGQEKKDI